jgi:hypothetical protein
MAARGWQVEVTEVAAVAARHGRDLGDPFGDGGDAPPWLDTVYVRGACG